MNSHSTAYLLIGGNLGDRPVNLGKARKSIHALAGSIIAASSIYETEPWGLAGQPDFLNQVLEIQTSLPPERLLEILQEIEAGFPQNKSTKYGARHMDIDILFFDDRVIDSSTLTVPHPQLHLRNFALVPLAEIAPGLYHPVFKKQIKELLDASPDSLDVHKFIP